MTEPKPRDIWSTPSALHAGGRIISDERGADGEQRVIEIETPHAIVRIVVGQNGYLDALSTGAVVASVGRALSNLAGELLAKERKEFAQPVQSEARVTNWQCPKCGAVVCGEAHNCEEL